MFIISTIEAAILGTVQGLTEFLPVSSTAHLFIFQKLFGLDQATYGLSFDMFTNLGTTLALIWYFRKDIWELLKRIRLPQTNRPYTRDELVPWWILGVTVIVGALGVVLENKIATTFRSLSLVAAMLVLFGIVMLWAEAVAKKQAKEAGIDTPKAFTIGLSQILAFVPGVSRSGATISTGLFLGVTREKAARFSFLLSIPVTLGAILKRMATAVHEFHAVPPSTSVLWFYLVGLVFSTIIGYYSIRFLLDYVKRSSLAVFSYYRFALAAVLVIYLVVSR
jgi:undecaprenyl-diphosphatase